MQLDIRQVPTRKTKYHGSKLQIRKMEGNKVERYGVPSGIDVELMRKRHEEIFIKFDALVADPDIQREVQLFAKYNGRLSLEDLERQFTV